MQEYEGGRDMQFGEMLDWALRLRAFGVLRTWVGMSIISDLEFLKKGGK